MYVHLVFASFFPFKNTFEVFECVTYLITNLEICFSPQQQKKNCLIINYTGEVQYFIFANRILLNFIWKQQASNVAAARLIFNYAGCQLNLCITPINIIIKSQCPNQTNLEINDNFFKTSIYIQGTLKTKSPKICKFAENWQH